MMFGWMRSGMKREEWKKTKQERFCVPVYISRAGRVFQTPKTYFIMVFQKTINRVHYSQHREEKRKKRRKKKPQQKMRVRM